jgi:hypothetical protein
MKLTDEEILDLAHKHGFHALVDGVPHCDLKMSPGLYVRQLTALAHAIAKRQREIDAALCLSMEKQMEFEDEDGFAPFYTPEACANAIQNHRRKR